MTRVLGLTGSIGMGKSTTAAMFRDLGVPVWDADAVVHAMYQPGGAAVALIAQLCPDAIVDCAVSRARLRDRIATNPEFLSRIESLVHPLIARDRAAFVQQARDRGEPLVVLDVPLLFETGADGYCDAVVVVTAPPEVQRQRVLSRPGMTPQMLDNLLAKQLPDADKKARATHVITTQTLDHTREQVRELIERYRHA